MPSHHVKINKEKVLAPVAHGGETFNCNQEVPSERDQEVQGVLEDPPTRPGYRHQRGISGTRSPHVGSEIRQHYNPNNGMQHPGGSRTGSERHKTSPNQPINAVQKGVTQLTGGTEEISHPKTVQQDIQEASRKRGEISDDGFRPSHHLAHDGPVIEHKGDRNGLRGTTRKGDAMVVLEEGPQNGGVHGSTRHTQTYRQQEVHSLQQIHPTTGDNGDTLEPQRTASKRYRKEVTEVGGGTAGGAPRRPPTHGVPGGDPGTAEDVQSSQKQRNTVQICTVDEDKHQVATPIYVERRYLHTATNPRTDEAGFWEFGVYDDGGSGEMAPPGDPDEGADNIRIDTTAPRRSREQTGTLPLYLPRVTASEVPLEHDTADRWTTSAATYERLTENILPEFRKIGSIDSNISHFTESEVQQMVDIGIIIPTDESSIKVYARAWGRPEIDKGRRRLIVHPECLNALIKRAHAQVSVAFPSRQDIYEFARKARENNGLVECDLRCFYWQSMLAEEVRPYFGLAIQTETRLTTYVFTRLAMGFSPSALVASNRARDAIPKTLGTVHCLSLLQIDNIFVTANASMDKLANELSLNLARSQLEAKYVKTRRPSSSDGGRKEIVDILGYQFGISRNSVEVRLPQHFKLKSGALWKVSRQRTSTVHSVFKAVGVALRAVYVKNMPFAHFYSVLVTARIAGFTAHHNGLTSRITLHKSARRQFKETAKIMDRNAWSPIPNPVRCRDVDTTLFLACDATPSMFGWVRWRPGMGRNARTGGGEWSTKERQLHITSLEARCIAICITRFVADKPCHHGSTVVFTDSRTTTDAVTRGFSLAWEINLAATLCRKYGVRLVWVESAANPADKPSRDIALHEDTATTDE